MVSEWTVTKLEPSGRTVGVASEEVRVSLEYIDPDARVHGVLVVMVAVEYVDGGSELVGVLDEKGNSQTVEIEDLVETALKGADSPFLGASE